MFSEWQFSWHDIIFVVITLLWWAEFRFFPSRKKEDENREEKSFQLILAAILTTILLSIIFTLASIGKVDYRWQFHFKIIGLVIYGLGLILRYWSSILLGKYFTRSVSVESDQKLVSNGPYRLIRHPLYLGLLLLTSGVPIYLGNIPAVLFGLIFLLYALSRRIEFEEKLLEKSLGEKYRNWKKERAKLIPFIY